MTTELWGMVLSLVGMAITIVSFQARKNTLYLLTQSIGSVFYLVSYIFSGGGICVFLNLIFLIRNTLYMKLDETHTKERRIVCIGLCVSYVITYALYICFAGESLAANLWSLLPIIGSLFGTIAASQVDPIRLRLFKSGDSISWLAFNAHLGLGALGGILGEIFNLGSIAIAVYRFRDKTKTPANK